MRITYLNPSGQMGGAEACLIDALVVVRQVRPDWSLSVVLGEDGPLVTKAKDAGAEVHVLAFPPELARLGDSGQTGRAALGVRMLSSAPSAIRYRSQLRRLLSHIKPDVIHTNGLKMHVMGALAKPQGSALLWHIHDYVGSRSVMAGLMRKLALRADAILANSQSVADDTRGIVGKAARIVPVLNVVDLDEFTPEGPALDLDQLSGLPPAPDGTVRVGLIATLAWWKGHRLFLQGLAEMDPSLPVRGYYIGGALYRTQSQESLEQLRRFAQDLGLGNRIGFTGVVSEPAAAIRALDVLVHTSTEPEPFGRVIAEAMACARPVITTGLGGAAEIVRLGDFAIAFDPQHPDALAAAMTKLAVSAKLRREMGCNGQSTARQYFGRERLARELPPVYEEVFNRIHGPNVLRPAHA